MSFLAEERSLGSGKPRSPSPPVRRSISTDRGALMRSRVKPDTIDNPSVMKLQFLARAAVNKSVATIPVIPSIETNRKGYSGSQDNIYDAFSGLQKVKPRKIHSENEEDQFKQVLNVRQGGIRKSKPESKVKAKHQLPAKVNLLSDGDIGGTMEETRKNDFSEPENEHGLVQSPTHGNLRAKKLHRNFSRNSQYAETRYIKYDLHFKL